MQLQRLTFIHLFLSNTPIVWDEDFIHWNFDTYNSFDTGAQLGSAIETAAKTDVNPCSMPQLPSTVLVSSVPLELHQPPLHDESGFPGSFNVVSKPQISQIVHVPTYFDSGAMPTQIHSTNSTAQFNRLGEFYHVPTSKILNTFSISNHFGPFAAAEVSAITALKVELWKCAVALELHFLSC